jgi:hypothetical protein
MRIGGVCAVVATVAMGLFVLFASLHCMMQINNKKICISYKKNILYAVITVSVAGEDKRYKRLFCYDFNITF